MKKTATQYAVPFESFDDAVKHLPLFVGGLDLLGQHHSVDDLRYLVQLELDRWVVGESNTIVCKRQSDTTRRYRKCKAYISRCNAT